MKQISTKQRLRLANLICKLEQWNKPNGPTVADIANDVRKTECLYNNRCEASLASPTM